MEHLKFKNFEWPVDPAVYREKRLREPEFIRDTDGNVLYSGLSDQKVTITAEGEFYGADAFRNYKALEALMEDVNYGALIHPLLGTRYGYMTGLEMIQEAEAELVAYRFTFTGMIEGGSIPG